MIEYHTVNMLLKNLIAFCISSPCMFYIYAELLHILICIICQCTWQTNHSAEKANFVVQKKIVHDTSYNVKNHRAWAEIRYVSEMACWQFLSLLYEL